MALTDAFSFSATASSLPASVSAFSGSHRHLPVHLTPQVFRAAVFANPDHARSCSRCAPSRDRAMCNFIPKCHCSPSSSVRAGPVLGGRPMMPSTMVPSLSFNPRSSRWALNEQALPAHCHPIDVGSSGWLSRQARHNRSFDRLGLIMPGRAE